MTPLHDLDHRAARPGADLDARLRAADPLPRPPAATRGAVEEQRLGALRARVEHQLYAQTTAPGARAASPPGRQPRRWQRPRLAGGAVLALSASALLTVGALAPQIFDTSAQPPLATATVSQDGQISCDTGGYAQAIPPAQAPVRLLPSALAPSWSLSGVRARSSIGYGACQSPSLQALATNAQDTVTATVSVVGPVHVDLGKGSLGTASATTVDGHDARLFDLTDTVGGAQTQRGVGFTRWVWTDELDQTWQVETDGYDLAGARAVVAGVHTDGDQVALDTDVTADLQVVHHRTGAPYQGDTTSLVWSVVLFDGTVERTLDVNVSTDPDAPEQGEDPAEPDAWLGQAAVGDHRTTIGGHPALVGPTFTEDTNMDGLEDRPATQGPGAQVTPVSVQINPTTTAWTLARGDLPAITTLIASLADAPRDDPRLKDLDEG